MKTKMHLYDYFENEKVPDHDKNKKNGYLMARCGYQRKEVTFIKSDVDCKICLKIIKKENKDD